MPRLKEVKLADVTHRSEEAWAIANPSIVALDTETTGFSWYDTAFCATVAWDMDDGRGVQSHYIELEYAVDLEDLLAVTPAYIFHNAKFDLQKLIAAGVLERDALSGRRIEDTEGLYHLFNPTSEDKGLKAVARELLGATTKEDEAIRKACAKLKLRKKDPDFGYHLLPREVIYPYALKDVEFTWRIWRLLRPKLAGEQELLDLYEKEMDLTLVLLDLEANGLGVDMDYVSKALKSTNGEILKHERQISKLTGKEVWYPEKQGQKTPDGCLNPGSWQQLLAAFEARGTKVPNTRSESLEPLDDDLARSVLALRGEKKLKDYLVAITNETRDGIIHPGFRQHEPKTGRMSSAKEKG